MGETPSAKQRAVYEFIESYQMDHGASPTLKELREHFHVSSDNSILKHLTALEEKGWLQRDPTPRGIRLLNAVKARLQSPMIQLPLLGSIPAGTPTLTDAHVDAWVSVAENMVRHPKESYLLKVRGDSMINAGIFDGDTVIVHQRAHPKNQDIVVALVDHESTLKRFVFNGDRAYLKAENPDYPDIYPAEELTTQGVVTGLIRSFS